MDRAQGGTKGPGPRGDQWTGPKGGPEAKAQGGDQGPGPRGGPGARATARATALRAWLQLAGAAKPPVDAIAAAAAIATAGIAPAGDLRLQVLFWSQKLM